MSQVGDELETIVSDEFGFKPIGQSTILPSYNEKLPFASLQNLDISNDLNIFAAASGGKAVVGDLQNLRDHVAKKIESEFNFIWEDNIDDVIMVKFYGPLLLIITLNGHLYLFDYNNLNEDKILLYTFTSKIKQVQLYFNSLILLLSDNTLNNFNLKRKDNSTITNDVVSYDLQGSLLTVIYTTQLISTYNTDGLTFEESLKFIFPEELKEDFENGYQPISISILNQSRFLIVIGEPTSESESDASYNHKIYVATVSGSSLVFQESFDIAPAFGSVMRYPTYYNVNLKGLIENEPQLNILGSSCSSELSILGSNNVIQPSQDSERAVLPISKETDNDTNPIGMSLDISSRGDIADPCPGIDKIDQLALIYLLSNEGTLIIDGVYNADAIKKDKYNLKFLKENTTFNNTYASIMSEPSTHENIKPLDQILSVDALELSLDSTNDTEATSFQAPTFGSTSFGAFNNSKIENSGIRPFKNISLETSNTPTFGSSAFGTSSFGSLNTPQTNDLIFGTSTLGKEPESSPKKNTKANSFGNPSFGNPSFGNTTFGKSSATTNNVLSFGSLSLNAKSDISSSQFVFGSSTFGATSFGNLASNNENSSTLFGKTSFGSNDAHKLNNPLLPSNDAKTESPFATFGSFSDAKNKSPFALFGSSNSAKTESPFASFGSSNATKAESPLTLFGSLNGAKTESMFSNFSKTESAIREPKNADVVESDESDTSSAPNTDESSHDSDELTDSTIEQTSSRQGAVISTEILKPPENDEVKESTELAFEPSKSIFSISSLTDRIKQSANVSDKDLEVGNFDELTSTLEEKGESSPFSNYTKHIIKSNNASFSFPFPNRSIDLSSKAVAFEKSSLSEVNMLNDSEEEEEDETTEGKSGPRINVEFEKLPSTSESEESYDNISDFNEKLEKKQEQESVTKEAPDQEEENGIHESNCASIEEDILRSGSFQTKPVVMLGKSTQVEKPVMESIGVNTDVIENKDINVQAFEDDEIYLANTTKPSKLDCFVTGPDLKNISYSSTEPNLMAMEATYYFIDSELSVLQGNIEQMEYFIIDQTTVCVENRTEKSLNNIYTWRIPEAIKMVDILSQKANDFNHTLSNQRSLEMNIHQQEIEGLVDLNRRMFEAKEVVEYTENVNSRSENSFDDLTLHQHSMQTKLRLKMRAMSEKLNLINESLNILKLHTVSNTRSNENPHVNQLVQDSINRGNLLEGIKSLRDEISQLKIDNQSKQVSKLKDSEDNDISLNLSKRMRSITVAEIGLRMGTRQQLGSFFKNTTTMRG